MKRLILALVMASASPAMAQSIYCKISEVGEQHGYFGPDIAFLLDRGAGTLRVRDGIIVGIAKKEDLAAKVSEISDNRFTASWEVDMTNASVQTIRMTYRATYRFGDQTVTIRAVPSGYDNEFMARGSCEVK